MSQPPRNKRPEDSPDDLELRPLQRLHVEPDEPIAETPRPAMARPGEPVPEGMVACASCMQIKQQHEVTLMPDGRLLCGPCAIDHKRRNAREESRMAAANATPAWFNVPDSLAWALALAIPLAGWGLLLLTMSLIHRIHSRPGATSPLHDATVLTGVVAIETLLVFVSLGITAMIFHGLDLPSLPNRLWKVYGLLLLDMTVFAWTCTLWSATPCLTLGYFVAVRPVFLGLGLIVLLGLESLEGAVTILMAWAAVCLALLSSFARSIFIPGANF